MVRQARLSVLCASLAVAGCAGLSVEVDVMDPAHVQDIRADLNLGRLIRESAGGTRVVDSAIRGICTAYQQGRLALYDVSLKEARKATSPTLILGGVINRSQASRDAIAQQSAEVDCVRQDGHDVDRIVDERLLKLRFRAIACPEGKCGNQALGNDKLREVRLAAAIDYQGLLDSYAAKVNARLESLQKALGLSITANLGAGQDAIKTKVSQEQTAARTKATDEAQAAARKAGYLGAEGNTLILDDIAFAATKAEKNHWAGKLNKAKGGGIFGSTDVVIKLESTGDFSVKGLVFDARSTALAARKATLSTLQVLAAGSGLPFEAPSGDGDGNGGQKPDSAASQASRSLAAAKAKLAADELANQHYRAALRRIAAATIAAADNVKTAADGQGRKDARAKAKSLFDANKPLLQAQAGVSK